MEDAVDFHGVGQVVFGKGREEELGGFGSGEGFE